MRTDSLRADVHNVSERAHELHCRGGVATSPTPSRETGTDFADSMADDVDFALALREMEGIGRVTAGRLLEHFGTYDTLRSYPREQVLTRMRGVSNAQQLVDRLFDDEGMQTLLSRASDARERLAQKRVALLTPASETWPERLNALPHAERPVVLFAFGDVDVLETRRVALFARPPLDDRAYEQSQALARHLINNGIVPVTGASTGFDVVVHKLSTDRAHPQPSLLVAPAGLARIKPNMRPTVAAVARGGGLCLSPFAMAHGPFEHDDRHRALVMAALADACVFVTPAARTPEAAALAWALEADRPVFDVGTPVDELPQQIPSLEHADTFDGVLEVLAR